MQQEIQAIINKLNYWVWGVPTIVLLLGTGVFLTILLRGFQFKKLGFALRLAFIKRKEEGQGDISHFQALMTALAATVGIGNIAGVATAIAIGGPGALFWMWITALFGMATKYSEALLAVKYRRKDKFGNMCGGPMYYLSEGLGQKWLAVLFAVFTALATFGIGNMTQSNATAAGVKEIFGLAPHWTGLALMCLTAIVILGGIKSIARCASLIVPVMIVFYFITSSAAIILNYPAIPGAFMQILRGAFTPTAATAGFLGASIAQTIRIGVARGIFSNESGLGSSPIAAAAAKTSCPVTQALVSMTQTFIDTIIVCTLTGLVIIISGEWTSGETGTKLSILSFNHCLNSQWGGIIVTIGVIFFAYSTLVGWGYYGEKAMEYLWGEKIIYPYRVVFCIFVFIGAVVKLDLVWGFSDLMNGLMAIPNLIGLLGLSYIIREETRRFL